MALFLLDCMSVCVLDLYYVNSVIFGPWMEMVNIEIFLVREFISDYFEKTHKALKFTFSIKA